MKRARRAKLGRPSPAVRHALFLLGAKHRRDATLVEVQRRYIRHVLNVCNYNRTLAAEVLGMARRTLQRMLPKL